MARDKQSFINAILPQSRWRKWWLAGAAVLTLFIVGSFVFLAWANMQVNDQPAPQAPSATDELLPSVETCSDELLAEANAPLVSSDQVALGEVADKITAKKGFDRDPNCLYVTLQYKLAAGDAAKSREYFDKLSKTYNPAEGYSRAFTVPLMSLDTLRKNVEFLEVSAKESSKEEAHLNETTAAGSEAADKYHKEHN